MSKIDEKDAWKAVDLGDYETAAHIWEQLISSCSSETEADTYLHGYGYALVGLKRWNEARAIYQRLYDKTGSHIYIHQLGMVEREAGNYDAAVALFRKEWLMLSDDDALAKAANLYEQGLIAHLSNNHDTAMKFAEQCLDLSMLTNDKIMQGCAHRLMGDLLRHSEPDSARSHYETSRILFEEAGDLIASREIDEKLTEIT